MSDKELDFTANKGCVINRFHSGDAEAYFVKSNDTQDAIVVTENDPELANRVLFQMAKSAICQSEAMIAGAVRPSANDIQH